MENGFDLQYLKDLSKKKMEEKSFFLKNSRTKKSVEICLIRRDTGRQVLVSEIIYPIFKIAVPFMKKAAVTNVEAVNYREFIYSYLCKYFETSRTDKGAFRSAGEYAFQAITDSGEVFPYLCDNLLDKIGAQFRDMFKTYFVKKHRDTDRLPLWWGEKTQKQIKNELKEISPNKPLVPLGGNFSTVNIKEPITFVPTSIMLEGKNGESEEVIFTELVYYDTVVNSKVQVNPALRLPVVTPHTEEEMAKFEAMDFEKEHAIIMPSLDDEGMF